MSQLEQREEAVFEAALNLPAEQRAAYLDQHCLGESNLRRRVEALIDAFERAGGFLKAPAFPLPAGIVTLSFSPTEKSGDRIGRYKILEQIGEGGCGVVYVAEQEEPVRRRVALKVIKLGMDTKQVIARFEAERQALATMDHPNIAKVFDAGATSMGRPYFVMELVRGIRITDYCDQNSLAPNERLHLFTLVCRAIQHAHQKGVIHRDIKPSNILVTLHDGVPVPKVIDFGIAKAAQGRLTDRTVYTAFEQFIGTPAYMSPEQAEMSGLDIDTRSDIYSLGVLLYELLTGKTPFGAQELAAAGLDEMRRTIREVEPVKPSARLTRQFAAEKARGGAPSQPSAFTTPHPEELIRMLRGDLDWIVMKCLEKDRAHRYETANGLAEDILRHLHHEPVTARSPSRIYLLKKLAQRNGGALLAAGIILVALLAAVLTLATSNARIRQEQNLKDQALREKGTALDAARDQLFVSLQNQAQARRKSRQIGQRLESLAAVAEAARLHPAAELRDNAIAAMALPDIEMGPVLRDWNPDTNNFAFDSVNQRYARTTPAAISIRTFPDDRELQLIQLDRGADGVRFTFSPDGRWFAWLDKGGRLIIRRWENGETINKDLSGKCSAPAFSPDSRRLVVGQDDSIISFDLSTGAASQWQSRDRIFSMDFSPDDRYLAVGYYGANLVSIYNAHNGHQEAELPLGASSNTIVAWHSGGDLIATGGSDPRIQIWDVKARRRVSVLEGHAQQVTFLAFQPGGDLLLSSSWDATVRLWQPSPGQILMRLPLVGWMGFSSDGRWAGMVSVSNQQWQVWGIVPSLEYQTFINSSGESMVYFDEGDISPDGRLLALAGSDGVRLWDIASGRAVAWLAMQDTMVAMFRANGCELLTCGPSDGLLRWPIRTTAVAQGDLQIGPPHRIAMPFPPLRLSKTANDRMLAVVGVDTCALVDLATESVLGPQMSHSNACYIAVSSGAERLASSGWHSDRVKVWGGQNGKLIKDLEVGLTSRVYFTPDNREMIISRSREFSFYDLKTLEVSRRLPRQIGLHPGHVAFTANGKMMALEMAPGLIHLEEISSGRTVARLEDPQGDISSWMNFTPDGTQLVVTARYVGAIHRWDLRAIRARLKTMNLDLDWPEFPAVAPIGASSAKSPRPLFIHVLNPSKA